jgi:hypothetical protein
MLKQVKQSLKKISNCFKRIRCQIKYLGFEYTQIRYQIKLASKFNQIKYKIKYFNISLFYL